MSCLQLFVVSVLVGALSLLVEQRTAGCWALLRPRTIGAGVSFGIKYALKTSALRVVSVPIHELLHGSTLIFVVFFSFIILGERPTTRALMCCLGLTGGLILTSYDAMRHGAVTVPGLVYNLAGAALAGCCFPLLRGAILELQEGSLAITAAKLFVGAVVIMPAAVVMEGFLAPGLPFWHLFDRWPPLDETSALIVVAVNVIVVAVEQFNITLMCTMMSAVSVGVVDAAKPPIQWGLSESLTARHRQEGPSFWAGTAVIVASGLAYLYEQWQQQGVVCEEELEALTLPLAQLDHAKHIKKHNRGLYSTYGGCGADGAHL